MKILHHLDPLLRISPKSENIQTFGCYQVSINMMLKFDGVEDIKGLSELVGRMAKAACDEIDRTNKENEICPILSNPENPADTMSTDGTPEPKSPIVLP